MEMFVILVYFLCVCVCVLCLNLNQLVHIAKPVSERGMVRTRGSAKKSDTVRAIEDLKEFVRPVVERELALLEQERLGAKYEREYELQREERRKDDERARQKREKKEQEYQRSWTCFLKKAAIYVCLCIAAALFLFFGLLVKYEDTLFDVQPYGGLAKLAGCFPLGMLFCLIALFIHISDDPLTRSY